MDKTININLGGSLFKIDEDAFNILRDYLQSINNRFANIQGGITDRRDLSFTKRAGWSNHERKRRIDDFNYRETRGF